MLWYLNLPRLLIICCMYESVLKLETAISIFSGGEGWGLTDWHAPNVWWILYSGLFSTQKFSQERQKLNFKELNFQRDCKFRRIFSLRMFEFESKMALTISSVVNKKRQCVAIMFIKIFQNCHVRLSRYLWRSLSHVTRIFRRALPDLDGYEAPSVVSKRRAASMHSFISGLIRSWGQCFGFRAFWIWQPLEISIKLQNAFVLQR